MSNYIKLYDLEVYKLGRRLSSLSWLIYSRFSYSIKINIGDQFIRSVDSVGANIAEGYGRFYFLDKIRFYYQSRGSLFEAEYWIDLLVERNLIQAEESKQLKDLIMEIRIKLSRLITETRNSK